MVRPTYVEVDLAAVEHNVGEFARLVSPSEVCVVVKADGYGHGDVPVANAALRAGASHLAVALTEEGARLREAGIDAPILLLSEPSLGSATDVARWELTPTVYSPGFIDALSATGSKMSVHLKVDTGMHRVGASPEDVISLVRQIHRAKSLDLAAAWTHFAVADEDPVFTNRQIDLFDQTVSSLDVPAQHLCNTPGALHFPEARRSMCRIGLGTYGLYPTPESRDLVDLRPAMRLVSQVAHIQSRLSGDRPSYGRTRDMVRDGRVATVPVGYADGYGRRMSSGGFALIGGRRHPLAGTVTMDQIVVDVGDFHVEVGDEVVLLGRQADESVTAEEWAQLIGTISYEVVCSIGPRVPRRYS